MGGYAWVTLTTNDSYSLGALVLAHSLRQAGTKHQLAVLVTPGVTHAMRQKLASVFNIVQEVNVLDSKDESNLRLLKRPELGITFTKLHCWRLTQFEKCVFMDADTLVLMNADELFEREEFSAAPDVGWPDCFNSGVFVFRPSIETFEKLVQFALEKGSFDGGDQGLLNLYFCNWAHQDISKHLPFIYNMCSTASYSYLPAFKQYGQNAKIVHFIGSTKPWLQYFNMETKQVQPSAEAQHLQPILQRWWDIFCTLIHPNLNKDMSRNRRSNENNISITHSQQSKTIYSPQSYTEVWDPWEDYQNQQNHVINSETLIIPEFSPMLQNEPLMYFDGDEVNLNVNLSHSTTTHLYSNKDNIYPEINNAYQNPPSFHEFSENYLDIQDEPTITNPPNNIHINNKHTDPVEHAPASPLLPEICTVTTENISESNHYEESSGGLAGAFAQITLGSPKTTMQTALENHMRREAWERGNIDYMNKDSFDSIWEKITMTLAAGPQQQKACDTHNTQSPSTGCNFPLIEKTLPLECASVDDSILKDEKLTDQVKHEERIESTCTESPTDISEVKVQPSIKTDDFKTNTETPIINSSVCPITQHCDIKPLESPPTKPAQSAEDENKSVAKCPIAKPLEVVPKSLEKQVIEQQPECPVIKDPNTKPAEGTYKSMEKQNIEQPSESSIVKPTYASIAKLSEPADTKSVSSSKTEECKILKKEQKSEDKCATCPLGNTDVLEKPSMIPVALKSQEEIKSNKDINIPNPEVQIQNLKTLGELKGKDDEIKSKGQTQKLETQDSTKVEQACPILESEKEKAGSQEMSKCEEIKAADSAYIIKAEIKDELQCPKASEIVSIETDSSLKVVEPIEKAKDNITEKGENIEIKSMKLETYNITALDEIEPEESKTVKVEPIPECKKTEEVKGIQECKKIEEVISIQEGNIGEVKPLQESSKTEDVKLIEEGKKIEEVNPQVEITKDSCKTTESCESLKMCKKECAKKEGNKSNVESTAQNIPKKQKQAPISESKHTSEIKAEESKKGNNKKNTSAEKVKSVAPEKPPKKSKGKPNKEEMSKGKVDESKEEVLKDKEEKVPQVTKENMSKGKIEEPKQEAFKEEPTAEVLKDKKEKAPQAKKEEVSKGKIEEPNVEVLKDKKEKAPQVKKEDTPKGKKEESKAEVLKDKKEKAPQTKKEEIFKGKKEEFLKDKKEKAQADDKAKVQKKDELLIVKKDNSNQLKVESKDNPKESSKSKETKTSVIESESQKTTEMNLEEESNKKKDGGKKKKGCKRPIEVPKTPEVIEATPPTSPGEADTSNENPTALSVEAIVPETPPPAAAPLPVQSTVEEAPKPPPRKTSGGKKKSKK